MMCGFVVLLNRSAQFPSSGADPCTALAHRGPDASGHLNIHGPDWHAALHFRRLAVVDLDGSDRPSAALTVA